MPDEGCIDHSIAGKCIPREIDEDIRELAERQHGVVARSQLIAAGISRHAIDLRLSRGRLCSIHSSVYAVGHCQLSVDGRWLAAVLACGPGAALSHRSAGRLWGLIEYSGSAGTEVTRPGRFRARPGIVARRSVLPSDEIETMGGIPVTSVSRTILDLAGLVDRRRIERVMNEAEVQGLKGRLSLPQLLERYPRRRGSAVLRTLLREGTVAAGVTRSRLERRFVSLVETHGLPRPRLNATIAIRGHFPMVDCLWERERLIVELDGRGSHGTARAFEADRERDRILLAAGWRVVRVTWRQLKDDPEAVAQDLRRMLATASTL